jgi:hypothetical protein
MSRRTAAAIVVLAVAVGLAACSGDSTSGGIDTGGGATATPVTSSPSPSVSPSVSDSPSASSSPSESPSSAATTSGDLTADEFTEYADAVQPWYDEIVAIEGDISSVLIAVDSNEISQGQAARRLERLGYKYDPPVVELASINEPAALSEAHRAWLDGITFEALAVARNVELLRAGRYQRGATDPQVETNYQKASDKWTEWRETLQAYEQELGLQVPWGWPE